MSMRLRQHHIANNWPTPSLITPDLQSSVRYWRPHAVPPLSVKPPYRKVAWRFGRGFSPYPLPDASVPLGEEFINGKDPLLRSFRLRQPPRAVAGEHLFEFGAGTGRDVRDHRHHKRGRRTPKAATSPALRRTPSAAPISPGSRKSAAAASRPARSPATPTRRSPRSTRSCG